MLSIDYIAGLFDGEGCFWLGAVSNARSTHRPAIEIKNTHEGIIILVKHTLELWGIRPRMHRIVYSNRRCKPIYELNIDKIHDINVLCVVLKNKLVIKQECARLLAEFTMLRLLEGRNGKHHCRREEEIYQEMRILNRRGAMTNGQR